MPSLCSGRGSSISATASPVSSTSNSSIEPCGFHARDSTTAVNPTRKLPLLSRVTVPPSQLNASWTNTSCRLTASKVASDVAPRPLRPAGVVGSPCTCARASVVCTCACFSEASAVRLLLALALSPPADGAAVGAAVGRRSFHTVGRLVFVAPPLVGVGVGVGLLLLLLLLPLVGVGVGLRSFHTVGRLVFVAPPLVGVGVGVGLLLLLLLLLPLVGVGVGLLLLLLVPSVALAFVPGLTEETSTGYANCHATEATVPLRRYLQQVEMTVCVSHKEWAPSQQQ